MLREAGHWFGYRELGLFTDFFLQEKDNITWEFTTNNL